MKDGGTWSEPEAGVIDYRVEASDDCGGNAGRCVGVATAAISVPHGKKAVIDWFLEWTGEAENLGYDVVIFEVYDVGLNVTDQIVSLFARLEDGGCSTDYQTAGDTLELPYGDYELSVIFDTIDGDWHTADVGVRLTILSCDLVDDS